MDISVGLLVIDPPGVRVGVLSAQQVHALLSGIPACAKYGLAAPGALADGAMHTDKAVLHGAPPQPGMHSM